MGRKRERKRRRRVSEFEGNLKKFTNSKFVLRYSNSTASPYFFAMPLSPILKP
jgi:hypothetical protein